MLADTTSLAAPYPPLNKNGISRLLLRRTFETAQGPVSLDELRRAGECADPNITSPPVLRREGNEYNTLAII